MNTYTIQSRFISIVLLVLGLCLFSTCSDENQNDLILNERILLEEIRVNQNLSAKFYYDDLNRLVQYCFSFSPEGRNYTCFDYTYESNSTIRFSEIVKKQWEAGEVVSEQPIQFYYANPHDTIPEFYTEDDMKFQLIRDETLSNRYIGFIQSRLSDGVEVGRLSITYDSDTITGWLFVFQTMVFQERVEVADYEVSNLKNPLSGFMYHYPFVLADIETRDSEYDVTAKDINSFLQNIPASLKLSHSRNCIIGTRELNYSIVPDVEASDLPSKVFRTSLSTNCELPLGREIEYFYISK